MNAEGWSRLRKMQSLPTNKERTMQADTLMQLALDHAARAEELDAVGSPGARTHIEFAKFYGTTARETRIAQQKRSSNYAGIVFKPVIVQTVPALPPRTPGEADIDLDDAPDNEQ